MSKVQTLAELWDEVMEGSFWHDLSDDELYALQDFLWATHQDALMEWTRRRMRAADPKR